MGPEDSGESAKPRDCVASSSVGGRPGGRTHKASMSVPNRCAERQARLMIRCDFGCGSISASTRSATACWLSGSRVACGLPCASPTSRSISPRASVGDRSVQGAPHRVTNLGEQVATFYVLQGVGEFDYVTLKDQELH